MAEWFPPRIEERGATIDSPHAVLSFGEEWGFRRLAGCAEPSPLTVQCSLMGRRSKQKRKRLRVAKEAKRRARLGLGLPPPERIIIDKRLKPPKHKKPLTEED